MKIKGKLVGMVLVPMIICSMVIGGISIVLVQQYLDEEQKTILKVALEGFSGDVNAFDEQDVDITVFENDTGVESSIKGAKGTKASEIVVNNVIKEKKEYFDTNVDVNGVPYYGYYIPTDKGMLFAGKSRAIINKNVNKMVGYIVGVEFFMIAVFTISGFLIARNMGNKIKNAAVNIKKVAEGDLTHKEEVIIRKSKDEINEINKSIKNMLEELSEIIMTTSEISKNVNNSSKELDDTAETTMTAMNDVSKAVEEIASGLQSQSQAVQAVVENIQGINGDIDSIKLSANEIEQCSTSLDENSNIMHSKMTEMSESNQMVNNSIESISKKIQTISDVVENVKGIVSVIGDISSQTKMLSLNASIEAARAGEAGKGFAVVATSISDLSAETSYQVGEITTIINTLVKDFDECIRTIDETVADGQKQKNVIGSVISQFDKLSDEIEKTSDRVQLIGGAVEKAVNGINAIYNEMEELASIVQNSAASTQEVNASVEEINALISGVANTAEELSNKADDLNNCLGFFKV